MGFRAWGLGYLVDYEGSFGPIITRGPHFSAAVAWTELSNSVPDTVSWRLSLQCGSGRNL